MNKEQSEQLKQLILNEMAFRKEFRAKRQELENLVDPITKHVRECRKWISIPYGSIKSTKCAKAWQ